MTAHPHALPPLKGCPTCKGTRAVLEDMGEGIGFRHIECQDCKVKPERCPFCGLDLVFDINEGAPVWYHPDRLKSTCWLSDAYVVDEIDGEGGIAEWNTRSDLTAPASAGDVEEIIARAICGGDPERLVETGDPLGEPRDYPAWMLCLPEARRVAGVLNLPASGKVATRTIEDRDIFVELEEAANMLLSEEAFDLADACRDAADALASTATKLAEVVEARDHYAGLYAKRCGMLGIAETKLAEVEGQVAALVKECAEQVETIDRQSIVMEKLRREWNALVEERGDRAIAAESRLAEVERERDAAEELRKIAMDRGDLMREGLADAVGALKQCAEAPHSGWTIAQAIARKTIDQIKGTPDAE